MATIEKFEDLPIWQEARLLCQYVYLLVSKPSFSKDFDLVRQINRSSGSAMDNIAEGFERRGSKEFSYFLSITKGSLGEVRSQLYRAFDKGHISDIELSEGKSKCIALSKQTSGFMNYLKKYSGTNQVKEPAAAYTNFKS